MFATVRRYEGLSEPTVAALRERAAEIATVLGSVPGIGGWQLIRTRDGVIVVTLGDDEASLVEAGRRFVAWLEARVRGFRRRAQPEVWAGEVLIRDIQVGTR